MASKNGAPLVVSNPIQQILKPMQKRNIYLKKINKNYHSIGIKVIKIGFTAPNGQAYWIANLEQAFGSYGRAHSCGVVLDKQNQNASIILEGNIINQSKNNHHPYALIHCDHQGGITLH